MMMGDTDQLRPVGTGQPFFDMLMSGRIPTGRLTEVHRHAGQIGIVCESIRRGDKWIPLDSEGNFQFIQTGRGVSIVSALDKLLRQLIVAGWDNEDIQIICPINKKGDANRVDLNKQVQKFVEERPFDPCWRKKLAFTRNCLLNPVSQLLPSSRIVSPSHYFGNGQVVKVGEGDQSDQVRVISLPSFPAFSRSEISKFTELGHVITGHKSQGSEWPLVIVIADPHPGATRICDSSWWLTAVSRATQNCIVIGNKMTVINQCRQKFMKHRKTFLRERLQAAITEDINAEEAIA
jgi:ATP-dependent exoDNAse (exonuclease V) alpha subunit